MALPTVLENIVTKRKTHLAGIAERIGDATPGPSTRSLYDSLNQPGHQFIMECKSASPSLGVIRADYHPGDIARIYSRYAAGISVLCEPERFHGDYDHLATVAASTHLPVLCKDFIIDPVQVRAARHYGADAILLMLSVLSDEEYTELAELAKSYNLDILTEVIDEEEMARAEKLGAKIIGINHRNLHDLTIDLSRSAKLAKLLPEGALLVSESGIRDHGTVVELAAHSDAFLVGSQLTGSPDVDEACRKLLFGDLKVCGLTQGTSAQAARALGATYGGLIFEEASPRFIDKDKAVEIMDAEPGLKYVAVIRNLDSMRNIPADPRIVAYQIHAELNEPPAIPEDKEFWLAINADNPPATIPEADRYVLDKGQGGSGQAFDWRTIEKLPLSDEQLSRTLLAGGLNEENIEGALRVVAKQQLAGVDLNSGVERAPGIKDAVKLRECSKKIRTFHI